MKNSSCNKPISALWFYFFALFFGGLGLSAFVILLTKHPSDWFMSIWAFVMALIGLAFLLEPLDRKKLLPPSLAHFYLQLQKSFKPAKDSVPRGTKITVTISFFAMLGIIAGLITSNDLLGSTWTAARIYAVGMFSLCALFQLLMLTGILLGEKFGSHASASTFIRFFSQNLRTDNQSTRSAGIGVMVSFLSVAGFFVSIWIPEGNIIGPAGLVFMVMVSFGQMLVFGREEDARITAVAELKTAHDMQMNLMPVSDPQIPGFDISGICQPALEVGGDYYDYVWLDEEHTKLGIAMADVSGKAMKAAMTAVMTSGMIYREIGSNSSPKTILQNINRPMYLKTSKHIFTALSFAMLDSASNRLTFSNAGQMHPILRRGGDARYLKVPGNRLPLGVLEEIHYDEIEEPLLMGDILFFYTDGIPEAMNEKKELFGFERLEQFVRQLNPSLTAKEIMNQLLATVQIHTGTAQQHDDMTVVIVKVK